MSNIGYAVFGSPKGIAVVSNGLFKTLNLNKSLYLDSSHVVLEKGEQAIMIRRIPSNRNDLEKKDALLVVLYENALQYGENRPGGFVGSAICFKDKMPNAEKMMSGLFFLFNKIKENVDADNRFKAIDSSNWNITLPDANKEFGLEESKLNFAPITESKKNVVIKLNSLEREFKSVLYNFALNKLFHSSDYLYASSNAKVVEKIKANNTFTQLPLAEIFNYNKHLKIVNERLDKGNENLTLIKSNLNTVSASIKNLESDFITKTNEVKKIENDILEAKNEVNEALRRKSEIQRELDELKRLGNRGSNLSYIPENITNHNEDSKNGNELQEVINNAVGTLKKLKDNASEAKFSDNQNVNNRKIIEDYFDKLPKRKAKKNKVRIIFFSALIVFLLTFLSLFIWKTISLNSLIEKTKKKEKLFIDKAREQEESISAKQKEFLDNLRNSEKSNHTEFKKLADNLLENYLDSKYETNSEELNFINKHKWQFWEFDYINDRLVDKLVPGSKSTYFITLDKNIKPLNPSLRWKGEDELDVLFKEYLKEPNDIYQNIDDDVLNDSKIIKAHFKWMIVKENGELDKLKKGSKIKLPFFKK